MAVLSMFYGIIISMYYFDNRQHKLPHIHVRYQDHEAVLSLPEGNVIDGDLPSGKMKLVQAWLELHKDDLIANWTLAINGEEVFKIDPLR
ncbi:MAG: DUF4160 domain-containing protein [Candidatus Kapaibacteriota bacterium]|jgi:hypothetical protein